MTSIPSMFDPRDRRLLLGVCLGQVLLLALPVYFAPRYTWMVAGALLCGGLALFSVQRSLLLLLFLNIALPVKVLTGLHLPGGIRFQEGLLLLVGLFALIDLLYRRHLDIRTSPADGPLLVFLGAVALSAGVGLLRGHEAMPVLRDTRYLLYYGAFFAVTQFVSRRDVLRLFVPFLVLAGLAVAMGYILEFFGAVDLSTGTRFVRVARLQGLILPLAVLLVVNQLVHDARGYPRWLLWGVLLPLGLALVLTVGRSMWLALGVGLVATVYMRDFARPQARRRLWRSLLLVFGVLAVVGLLVFFVQQLSGAAIGAHVVERSHGFFDLARAPTLLGRFFAYTAALELIGQYPFLGSGQGATLTYPLFNFDLGIFEIWTTWTLDSLYLTLLLKMGLVGLVAFLWLCLRCLRLAYRTFRASGDPAVQAFASGAVAVLCAWGSMGLTDGSMVNGRFALVYAVFFGMIAVMARPEKADD